MKIMNININKILLLLLFVSGLLISCEDYLDKAPDNRAEVDTEEKITKLLVSAYPTSSFIHITETSSDNMDNNGGLFTEINRLQSELFFWRDISDIGTDSPQSLWDACYSAIATSNQALKSIEEMGNPASLNPQKGEALITRAYSHFILVNVFSKHYSEKTGNADLGIPYMLEPETTVAPHYERGTVSEVYEKINADIETGLPLIDDNIYSVPKYHFNKKAAYAFAARFNLYFCKYDKVIEYATQTLTNNPSSQLRDWKSAGQLSQNGSIRGDEFINASNRASLLLIPVYSLWGRIHGPYYTGARYSHNKTISDTETTASAGPWGGYRNFYYQYASYTGLPKVIFRKISEYFEYTDPVNGIGYPHIIHPAFTTDETLICRAEAYVMKRDYEKATADINTFLKAFSNAPTLTTEQITGYYSRLNYYTPTAPTVKKKLNPDFVVEEGTQENMLQGVLHLRRILTLHEGLRWFDVKRYGMEIYRRTVENNVITETDKLSIDDQRRAIQIPSDVITAGMQPNPR